MPRGETSVQVLETAELVLVLILEQAIQQLVFCLSMPHLLTHARLSQESSGCCCEWRPPVSTAHGVLGLVSLRHRADGMLVQRPLIDEAALATQADVSLRRFLVASQLSAASRFCVPRTAPIISIVYTPDFPKSSPRAWLFDSSNALAGAAGAGSAVLAAYANRCLCCLPRTCGLTWHQLATTTIQHSQ